MKMKLKLEALTMAKAKNGFYFSAIMASQNNEDAITATGLEPTTT